MRIVFIDEYDEELTSIESAVVPRVNECVLIDEDSYYVSDVMWDINKKQITVTLSDKRAEEKKEAPVVDFKAVREARQAIETGKQILREVTGLKSDIISIRQYLKAKKQ